MSSDAPPRRAVTVLSLDGGGIRGVIPAVVLDSIEQRTGRRIADLFDLVAGTSTGGILALGLVKPGDDGRPAFTARELLGLYADRGDEIFDKTSWHTVSGFGGLLHERYSVEPLEQLLRERFGDAMLSTALCEVVVPAYDLTLPGPFFFKRTDARTPGWDVPFWYAARATSAAPTYFEPMPLPAFPNDYSDREHALIDGGVFANNPAACAYAEALDVLVPADGPPPEVHVLSIGTGTAPERPGRPGGPVPYERARGWGLAEWAAPMLHVVFDGVSKTVDHQMKLLCRDAHAPDRPRYHRVQGLLAAASPAMDDASPENIEGLLADAQRIVREHDRALDEACEALVAAADAREAVTPA